LHKIADRSDVIAAYRAYLKREPESEDAIQKWVDFSLTRTTLRELFLHCDEFKQIAWTEAVAKMRQIEVFT
jgi:hypothetical protein